MVREILKFYNHQYRIFEKNLSRLTNQEDGNAIHNVRVGLKKVFCVIQFLKESGLLEIELEEKSKGIKTIYRSAGKIRETDIFQEILNHEKKWLLNSFDEYGTILTERKQFFYSDFREIINEYDFPSHQHNILEISKIIAGLKNKNALINIRRCIRKRIKKTLKMIHSPNFQLYLHQVRKQIKQLVYLLQIEAKKHPNPYNEFDIIPNLKFLEEQIGNWHDKITLLEDIRSFLSQHPKEETEKYYLLINDLGRYTNLFPYQIREKIIGECLLLNTLSHL